MAQNSSAPQHKPISPIAFLIGTIIFVFLNALGIYFGIKYFSGQNKTSSYQDSPVNTQSVMSLSGIVGINGTAPSGSTIAIDVRRVGDKSFMTVVPDIAAIDGAVWSWDAAEKGVAYEIQANIFSNGQKIGKSQILAAVAPADSESLEVNITTKPAAANVASSVTGSFNLNGYIPPGASITISTRQNNGGFNQVETSLAALDNGSWSWTGANQNQTYDIQATLVVNGQSVAQSQILTVTAPAHNELLSINSPLKPPAPSGAPISGKYSINGSVPTGATLSLGTRITGSNSAFTMVGTNIPPMDGLSWTWNQAQAGNTYDLQAYLVVNGNVVSSSPILSAAAPATGEILSINAQSQPGAPPSNALLTSCTSKNSSNQWQVRFTINNNSVVGTAQQYQLSAGTTSGNNSIVNVTVDPQNPGQAQDYTSGNQFNDGQTYFAQWAYATCASCGTFSSNSPSISFSCVTPSSTPVPSVTNVPTNTSVPSAIPPSNIPPSTAPTNTIAPTMTPTSTPVPTIAPINTQVPIN